MIQSEVKALAIELAKLLPRSTVQQEWFTREQAAAYIGATKEALRGMLRDKLFPVYLYKGRERIRRADIDAALLKSKTYVN